MSCQHAVTNVSFIHPSGEILLPLVEVRSQRSGSATENAEDTSAQTGVLRSSGGVYSTTFQTEITNCAVNQAKNRAGG